MLLASLTVMANDLIVIAFVVAVVITVFVLVCLNRLTKANERMAGTLDRIDQRQKQNEENG